LLCIQSFIFDNDIESGYHNKSTAIVDDDDDDDDVCSTPPVSSNIICTTATTVSIERSMYPFPSIKDVLFVLRMLLLLLLFSNRFASLSTSSSDRDNPHSGALEMAV
jgi:hypothetical protein